MYAEGSRKALRPKRWGPADAGPHLLLGPDRFCRAGNDAGELVARNNRGRTALRVLDVRLNPRLVAVAHVCAPFVFVAQAWMVPAPDVTMPGIVCRVVNGIPVGRASVSEPKS